MPQRIDAGTLLAALGGILLLVSLFLDWYEPAISAWTTFELVDLLLAIAALVAIAAALAGLLGRRALAADAERWLPAAATAAFVLVAVALINKPPAAVDRGLEAGAWIALAAATLLAAGAALRRTEIAVVVSRRSPGPAPGSGAAPAESRPAEQVPADPPPTEPLDRGA